VGAVVLFVMSPGSPPAGEQRVACAPSVGGRGLACAVAF
jgi:hypothetical protein